MINFSPGLFFFLVMFVAMVSDCFATLMSLLSLYFSDWIGVLISAF